MTDALDPTHLVVKRGHRGRYRLTLIHEGVRMSGDFTIEEANRAGKAHDALALSRFRDAVSTLAQRLELVQVKP